MILFGNSNEPFMERDRSLNSFWNFNFLFFPVWNLILYFCLAPRILTLTPDSGPMEGGTIVNITGRSLGESVDDLKEVSMAGVACRELHWVNAKNVMCVTARAPDEKPLHGFVKVETVSGGVGMSNRTQDGQALLQWTYNPSLFYKWMTF